MSEDFWQLHPTGDTAIMTNPNNHELGDDRVAMQFFWDCAENDWGLQRWPQSNAFVHELSQNIRSGDDRWWNQVLEQARVGALSEDNYNWLHGFPAIPIRHGSVKFWYSHKDDLTSPCTCSPDSCIDTCNPCVREKERRCRILSRREELQLPVHGFEAVIFLTPFNKAV